MTWHETGMTLAVLYKYINCNADKTTCKSTDNTTYVNYIANYYIANSLVSKHWKETDLEKSVPMPLDQSFFVKYTLVILKMYIPKETGACVCSCFLFYQNKALKKL